jgi:hypothetical protein
MRCKWSPHPYTPQNGWGIAKNDYRKNILILYRLKAETEKFGFNEKFINSILIGG